MAIQALMSCFSSMPQTQVSSLLSSVHSFGLGYKCREVVQLMQLQDNQMLAWVW